MNKKKKNPEQISSTKFGQGNVRGVAKQCFGFSLLSPTSPSNLKVVGALDNYSLVFVIFFFRTTKRLSRTSSFFS